MRYVLQAHVQCDGCGAGWDRDDLPVVEAELGAPVVAAEAVECPSGCGLLELDLAPIRLRTAWPTSRGAGRRLEQHHGRPTIRGHPVD